MTATGRVAQLSASVKSRPRRTRTPSVCRTGRDAGERDARPLPLLGRAALDLDRRRRRRRRRIGTRLDANAACTPGSASTRRMMSSTRRALAPFGSYALAGHVRSAASGADDVSKPSSKLSRFRKLRTKSSAPTSATSASDTCATTSALRTSAPLPVLPARAFLQVLLQLAARRSAAPGRGRRRAR